ncbi:MAG: FtsX-like permease family protein, partial [Planctomycetota bacterium]
MGLASLIARRSVVRRPGRALFSILGVALGVATVVGVTTLDHATMMGYARPRQAADRPDVEIVGANGAAAVRDLEGISAAARFFQNEAVVEPVSAELRAQVAGADERGDEALRCQLYAVEADSAAGLGLFGIERGRDLAPGADEVLIGPALARDRGLEPGDALLVSRPSRAARRRCVNGVLMPIEDGAVDAPEARLLRIVGVLTRERAGRAGGGNVVVVDHDVGLELFRGVEVGSRVWAKRDPSVDLERLQRTLAGAYSYTLNRGIVIGQAADERAFRTGVRMLGLLALVLGLYVIFHTLSMSLTERVLEVGTLHALGSARRQIGRVFFAEAAFLSGSGALLGAALGLLLAFAATRAGVTTLGVGKPVLGFPVPWGSVALLTLVGFGVALIGSVYPLVAIGGANTLRALRGEDALEGGARRQRGLRVAYGLLLALVVPGLYLVLVPVVGELTGELVATLLGVVGVLTGVVLLSLLLPAVLTVTCRVVARPLARAFPLAGQLATRALQEAPARVGVSACAIGLVAAGFVGLHGMTASLSGEVERWADEAVRHKVWVRGLEPTPFDAAAQHFLRYPGVRGVEKASARIYSPFLVVGASGVRMASYGPFFEDPTLLARFTDERTIVLSRRLAKDLGYGAADVVRLKARGGRTVEFEVLVTSDAYGYWTSPDERMYGVISDRWMANDFCLSSDVVDELCVRFDGSVPMDRDGHVGVLDASVRALQPDNDAFSLRTGADVRDYALRDIGRDFFVFDLLLFLMAGALERRQKHPVQDAETG